MYKVNIEDTQGNYVYSVGAMMNGATVGRVASDLNAFFASVQLHFVAKIAEEL